MEEETCLWIDCDSRQNSRSVLPIKRPSATPSIWPNDLLMTHISDQKTAPILGDDEESRTTCSRTRLGYNVHLIPVQLDCVDDIRDPCGDVNEARDTGMW